MKTNLIMLAEFGSDFVTRHQGERVREMLQHALDSYSCDDLVTVSLKDVDALTPSFVDECFGKLLQSLGEEQFRSRIAFANVNETTKSLLNAVLSRRAQSLST